MAIPSKKNNLLVLDRWHAALGKIRFNCGQEEQERIINDLVLKILIIELASCKHALPENWLAGAWNDGQGKEPLECLFHAVDEQIDALFPFELKMLPDKLSRMYSRIDANKSNLGRLSSIINEIISGITALFESNRHHDLVGLYYEQHAAIGKNKRGIVYTPVPLCKYIVTRTAGEKARALLDDVKRHVLNGDMTGANRVVNRFVTLRILDPACGTGSFLLETVNLLWNVYSEVREVIPIINLDASATLGLNDSIDVMANILERQVHGIDDDAMAVDLARVRLFLEAIDLSGSTLEVARTRYAAQLVQNMRQANALKSIVNDDGMLPFDVIVGNPPYVNYKKYGDVMPREFLSKYFRVFNGQADLSYYFFELHHRLLVDGGISGQISSRYFMQASHAVELRKLLVEDSIDEVDDLNATSVFKGIGIHPLLFFFTKALPDAAHVFPFRSVPAMNELPDNIGDIIEASPSKLVRQVALDPDCWCMLSDKELAIKVNFEAWPKLGSIGDCLGGAETGLDEAFINHVFCEDGTFVGLIGDKRFTLEPELVHPWIKNGHIHAFYHVQQQWCIYVPPDISEADFEATYPGTFAFLSCFKESLENRDNGNIVVSWYTWRRPRNVKNLAVPEKIVVPYKAPSVRASIDTRQSYCSYDVTIFVPNASCPAIEYIAGILNSSPVAWYFSTYGKKMGNIYEFYSGPLGNIRIPIPDAMNRDAIKIRVTRISSISNRGHNDEINKIPDEIDEEITRLRSEIDAIVFKLFSLPLEDIHFILEALGKDQQEKDMIMSNIQ